MRIKYLIILLLSVTRLHAQNIILVGKILSQDSLPVQGLKISIIGVDADITTSSGEFKLTIPASSNVKVGDKIECFLEGAGVPAQEYSILVPKNPLLNPLILRMSSNPKKGNTPEQNFFFSVAPYYEEPYGEAFYELNNKLVKVRCLPMYYHEVHSSPEVNNAILQPIDDIVKEAYRVILSNPGAEKTTVSDVRMILTDYKPLPQKYVVNWEPKGLKKAISTDVILNPNTKIYKSLKKDEYLEVASNESQILLFDIKNGLPGIYTLEFEIDVLSKDGSYLKQRSPSQYQILIPDREKNKGILLVNGYNQNGLSQRLLNLDDKRYAKLIDNSNPSSIYAGNMFNSDELQKLSDADLSDRLLKKK